jgi:hypothetical protein
MSKFTKGDWVADDYGAVLSGECIVCYTFTMGANHDAHLIAAAPEMYAMLEETLSEMWMLIDEVNDQRLSHMRFDAETPPDLCDKETLHRIQALLAKARGE